MATEVKRIPLADMQAWEPGVPYEVGDVVAALNPPTLWDRIRMMVGLRRSSPATREMQCVASSDGRN